MLGSLCIQIGARFSLQLLPLKVRHGESSGQGSSAEAGRSDEGAAHGALRRLLDTEKIIFCVSDKGVLSVRFWQEALPRLHTQG